MSGGSFDYRCFQIAEFADDLKTKIKSNSIKDEYEIFF